MFRRVGVGYVVKEVTNRGVRILGIFESRELGVSFCEDRLTHYRVHHDERWERKGSYQWGPASISSCGRSCSGMCDLFAPGLICRPKKEPPHLLKLSEVPRWALPE